MYSIEGYGEMLADAGRMEAYDRALRNAIRPGSVVADIGTGGALEVAVSGTATVAMAGTSTVYSLSQLVNVDHDEKVFTWVAGNLSTINYLKASATVATVILTWTAGDLTRMVVT